MKVLDQLQAFIQRAESRLCGSSEWLEDNGEIDVYVRYSPCRLCGEVGDLRVLDIANMQVRGLKGCGVYSRFLLVAHNELNPWGATYIENIHYPRLLMFHRRLGFLPAGDVQGISVYLTTDIKLSFDGSLNRATNH